MSSKIYLWIEDREGKAGYLFWDTFLKYLYPSIIVESKKNSSGLLKAVTKAVKYVDGHDSATIAKLLVKYFDGTSEASLKTSVDSYKKIDAWVKNMAMEETAYERLLDVIEQAGELKTRVPFHKAVLTEAADRAYREIYG